MTMQGIRAVPSTRAAGTRLQRAGFDRLLADAPRLDFRAGTELYAEHGVAGRAYYVHRGEIALWLATEHGNEIEVGYRGRGTIAGFETLLASRYNSSARAATDVQASVLRRADLDRLVRETPELASWLSTLLMEEITRLRQQVLDVGARSV